MPICHAMKEQNNADDDVIRAYVSIYSKQNEPSAYAVIIYHNERIEYKKGGFRYAAPERLIKEACVSVLRQFAYSNKKIDIYLDDCFDHMFGRKCLELWSVFQKEGPGIEFKLWRVNEKLESGLEHGSLIRLCRSILSQEVDDLKENKKNPKPLSVDFKLETNLYELILIFSQWFPYRSDSFNKESGLDPPQLK